MNQFDLWGGVSAPPTRCKITNDKGLLVFTSPYDADLVNELKTLIPSGDRKWNPTLKAWTVTPQFGMVLVKLAAKHCGETITVPAITTAVQKPQMQLLDVRYLGQCKDRGGGDLSAFAYLSNGEWGGVFPLTTEILRS